MAACPVGERRERAAELALQASDVGAVADALEPLQHQRHILAVLLDLFDWRLRERNRPAQRLRQDLRRLRHRSYVTAETDLPAPPAPPRRAPPPPGPRLQRVLHPEDAPRAGQRTAQRRLVIEIALDDVDAVARQRRRPLAVRLARQAAQAEPAALQRLRDRAALMACHSGDENRSAHSFVLVKYLVDFVVRLVK